MRSKLILFLTVAIASVCFFGLSAPVMAEDPPSGDQGSLQEGEDTTTQPAKKKAEIKKKRATTQPAEQIKPTKRCYELVRIIVPAGCTVPPVGAYHGKPKRITVTFTKEDETVITRQFDQYWVAIEIPCRDDDNGSDDGSDEGNDEGEGDASQGGRPTTQPADKEKKKTEKKKTNKKKKGPLQLS